MGKNWQQDCKTLPTAAGFPGKFTTRTPVGVAPQTPRERMLRGSIKEVCQAMALEMPSARRDITVFVASGVTSRGPNPVPPVVKITSACLASDHAFKVSEILDWSSGTTFVATISTVNPSLLLANVVNASVIAGPDLSSYTPFEALSEHVSTATFAEPETE
eukprot:CAMPEP_0195021196 /NCGR_PEP_ID=MMETSP0326_2-20130528/37317_1 /TAXON_ID=2866 ORGANISM="Crypthecodinium cohnii, Strain Seligo" /NCGR_SAMPLE_ID=MMETSP0326_2 /ASSEMBLY_ACC=CAM_ASM_000348 /LENGTH=160 /DNA_ID=CAMNT_0040040285 /DNA_START=280 /DNA_END=763 /DNA_ORIENTATION=+